MSNRCKDEIIDDWFIFPIIKRFSTWNKKWKRHLSDGKSLSQINSLHTGNCHAIGSIFLLMAHYPQTLFECIYSRFFVKVKVNFSEYLE